EEFDKHLEDGTLMKKPGTDSITLVFGEEHGGRVRCAGKGVTPTTYWHMPRKGASKEHIELKKQLDDERRANQKERERKDEEMKEAMNAQAKMMSNLVSPLKSQGVLKKKKTKSKKARSGKYKQKSLAYERLPLNSLEESQLKDQTELSTIGKCKLAHATLRNIIAWDSVLPSVPGQLVHGDPLKDDCVRVTVKKSIFKNHYPDEHDADPKTLLPCKSTCLLQNQPLSEPDEHDADPKTKKRNKKKPSDTKSGELKSRRSSKRLKTAA
ncbi:hypothetical protein MKW92_021253, partial [Papaver armeniacum]